MNKQWRREVAERRAYFSCGLNYNDPADWPIMSGLAGLPEFQRLVEHEDEKLKHPSMREVIKPW